MKNKKYISITSQTLAEAQKVLVSANFELEEIWSPDNKEEIQIWSNSKTDALVQLKIVSDEKDASRKDIVNEIIDVWYEIRSIREVFDQLIEEEEIFISKEEDYLLKFENKVKATRLEWEQNKDKMEFLYNSNIDPTVLTYLRLNEDEKERIVN